MRNSFRIELLQGAVKPSWLALVVTLLVAAAWMTAAMALVTPSILREQQDDSRWAEDSADLFFFATAKAYALGATEPTSASVIVLSNSSHLFAFPSESALAEAIEGGSQVRPEVHRLVAGALSLWEMRALAEIAAPGMGGVVIVGVGPPVLSPGTENLQMIADRPRLGLVSTTFDEELTRVGIDSPRRTGNYFVDNHLFFLARFPGWVRHSLTGETPSDWSEKRRRRRRSRALIEEVEQVVQRGMGSFSEHSAANIEVLERLIDQLRMAGARHVVLLEMLRNPARSIYRESDLAIYSEAISALAERKRVAYWDLDGEAGLGAEDFHDYTHLKSLEASSRYVESLAHRLGPLLEEQAEEDGA